MLYETTDTIGIMLQGINNITGSLFITLLLFTTVLLLLYIAISTPFGFPLEYSIILIIPLHLGILAYTTSWMPVAGCFMIYLGLIFAKNLLSR